MIECVANPSQPKNLEAKGKQLEDVIVLWVNQNLSSELWWLA